jgi:hypothetical protein
MMQGEMSEWQQCHSSYLTLNLIILKSHYNLQDCKDCCECNVSHDEGRSDCANKTKPVWFFTTVRPKFTPIVYL